MVDQPTDVLDSYRREAGLSCGELWLRYFELGGMSTALDLEAYLCGALLPTDHDHDVVAHALNERFVELGGNHPVPYQYGEIDAWGVRVGGRGWRAGGTPMISEGSLGIVDIGETDDTGNDADDDCASSQILRDAAPIALVATRLVSTWHAGAMTAEEAMRTLLETVSTVRPARVDPGLHGRQGQPLR